MGAASAHLARIGSFSRPTGGPGVAEARAYCADVLRRAGFAITEHSFEYSAFPASWAMPIAGIVAALGASTLFLARSVPALTAVAVTVLILAFGALSVLGRAGVLDFPFMRRRGVSLEAVRPDAPTPLVWLVAHVDSKWQPVSMIVRVAGIVCVSIGVVVMFLLALLPRVASDHVAVAVLILTWLAAVPLMLSVIGDRNHGTLDNASGVAAVLEAAQSLLPSVRVGVLITDAEEMALAGARAWVWSRPPSIALNCDSIDDDGPLVTMYSGKRPDALVARLEVAASLASEPVRVRRLIPGVLTDSVAFANAGWESLTLSRGTARTLRRIHTSRDTLSSMTGAGIPGAARVLAELATELG